MAWLHKIIYSFAFQLLLINLKKNQVLMVFWLLLFGFLVMDMGEIFGIPYLFLDPEFDNLVSWKSLFLMGFAFGVLSLSFHLTCYILDSERYRFLAKLKNPILNFAVNNSIIPIAFGITFSVRFANFQSTNGLENRSNIALELAFFWIGWLLLYLLAGKYFSVAKTKWFIRLIEKINQSLRKNKVFRVNVLKRVKVFKKGSYKVESYLFWPFKVEHTKAQTNADEHESANVFYKNHLNAVLLELIIFGFFFIMGLLSDVTGFQLPAGGSVMILFSFTLMFIGAVSFWLRGWSLSIFIGILLLFNMLFAKGIIKGDYQAFGLNYSKRPIYNTERILALTDSANIKTDIQATTKILENWKRKFGPNRKPKLVLLATSGGGLRAAMWTVRTLQRTDSILNGAFLNHTMFISGASGGMIGAAYYRELLLQSKINCNLSPQQPVWVHKIGLDILNPLIFSMVTNDLFVRLKRYNDGKYNYHSDRGFVFEEKLLRNLDNILDKRLYHYKNPEKEALIPMMVQAPTILNDGRKLYISPQGVSYLCKTKNEQTQARLNGVEYLRFFTDNDPYNLKFTSALRMNATFPYITPNVFLPADPELEVMDGGLSDNYGVSDAIRFLEVFKNWVQENTSGVVLVCIRDTPKERPLKNSRNNSLVNRWFNPIGSLYNNWARSQDYNNDLLIQGAKDWFTPGHMQVITFQYLATPEEEKLNGYLKESLGESNQRRASLSWHLTKLEKQSLFDNLNKPHNLESIQKLKSLLEQY